MAVTSVTVQRMIVINNLKLMIQLLLSAIDNSFITDVIRTWALYQSRARVGKQKGKKKSHSQNPIERKAWTHEEVDAWGGGRMSSTTATTAARSLTCNYFPRQTSWPPQTYPHS